MILVMEPVNDKYPANKDRSGDVEIDHDLWMSLQGGRLPDDCEASRWEASAYCSNKLGVINASTTPTALLSAEIQITRTDEPFSVFSTSIRVGKASLSSSRCVITRI